MWGDTKRPQTKSWGRLASEDNRGRGACKEMGKPAREVEGFVFASTMSKNAWTAGTK